MIAFGNNYWMKQMNEAIEWNDWLKMKTTSDWNNPKNDKVWNKIFVDAFTSYI